MRGYVAILASLDTKSEEATFLCEVVRAEGGEPLLVDTGVLGHPGVRADITREMVAQAAGTTLDEIVRAGDKAQALLAMAEGASRILLRLLADGQLGGVLSIGGSRGTALGTRVMQSLPVGVPKLMVSTMVSGPTPFGPYVGTKDITLMHSVADISGVNSVTRPIFANAARAIAAMSRASAPVAKAKPQVLAATMLGASTPLVEQIRQAMTSPESEVIAFHAVGTGGRAMEELIAQGLMDGVFDVSPAELLAHVAGGPFSAGPDRMRAAGQRGIPQVVAPGGLDFIIEGPPETLPTRYAGRKTMRHTPTITLVRPSPAEMRAVARLIAERLAESHGPAAVILPLRGFSAFSTEGQPLYDAESDAAFIETVRACAPSGVHIVELDAALNDAAVAETAVRLMREMCGM